MLAQRYLSLPTTYFLPLLSHLLAQRRGGRAVAQSVRERVEEARAVARLTDHARRAVAQHLDRPILQIAVG